MRRVGNDRSRFPSNPPENTRKIERLRDEDSVLETNAVGGGTFEVTGAIPEFTGVPAGLQQFYVAPIVTDGVVNMDDTARIYSTSISGVGNNLPFEQDLGNTFGSGTASLISVEQDLASACVYNFASTSFGSVGFGASVATIRVGPNFSVASRGVSNSIIVIQNGVSSLVTLTRPSGVPSNHFVRAGSVGISEDGTKICALWGTTVSANVAYIGIHNLDGSPVNAGYSTGLPFNDGGQLRMIDNGWVVFVSGSGLATCKATETLQGLRVLTTDSPLYRAVSNNVSDDNHIFYTTDASDDLYKVNLETGVISVYPEVFARYVGGSPTKTHDVTCFSMRAISGSKVVFGGQYGSLIPPDFGTFYPIYCAVVIDGGNANVSDSIYTEYATSSSGIAIVYAMTRTSAGDVVYAIQTPTPNDDFLVKVTGP
jgi:hypothetical protein